MDQKKILSTAAAIKKYRYFLISTHVNPDGDAFGSSLALKYMLKALGKKADIVVDSACPKELAFLPGTEGIFYRPTHRNRKYDAVFCLDCGSYDRIDKVQEIVPKGAPIINIDHHETNTHFGAINWIDLNVCATAELILALSEHFKIKISRQFAVCIYTAIVTETGHFSFSNTSLRSHMIAAEMIRYGVKPNIVSYGLVKNKTLSDLKLTAKVMGRIRVTKDGTTAWSVITADDLKDSRTVPGDSQEYLHHMVSLKGVHASILFRQTPEGTVKASARTDGTVSASKLMLEFGGGGHPRAAGCTLKTSLKNAQKRVLDAVKRLLDR